MANLLPNVAGLASVPSVSCTTTPTYTSIKDAFNLAFGPTNTGKDNLGVLPDCSDNGPIRQKYPQGVAASSGGSGFYWQLTDSGNAFRQSLTFKYQVLFEPGFEFVKGGKLPGIYGGSSGCGGGADAAELGCFSARLMWRALGDGEVYLYAPYDQADGFCDRPNYFCNFDYGHGVEKGSFTFAPGQWYQIEERIKDREHRVDFQTSGDLNTVGELDGHLMLFVDDILRINLDDVNFRVDPALEIHGAQYSTFFGGSSAEWAPLKDEYAQFRNFEFAEYSDSLDPIIVDATRCDREINGCHEAAECVHEIENGSEISTCKCIDGWIGDGTTCEEEPNCDNLQCHEFGHCSVRNGVPFCFCNEGYFGDGFACGNGETRKQFMLVNEISCDTEPVYTAIREAFNLPGNPGSTGRDNLGKLDACAAGETSPIRQKYPQGVAGGSGGSYFYWELPAANEDYRESLSFKYEVMFEEGFEFVKGGKLPGLFGGKTGCSGGANAAEAGCFSTRLMWRTGGAGELYLYAPYNQAQDFCDRENYHCNFDYGHSVDRGAWIKDAKSAPINPPEKLLPSNAQYFSR